MYSCKTFYCLLLVVHLLRMPLFAQSTAGLTGMRDSSFTTAREYEKLKKHYPFIEIARPASQSGILVQKNIPYKTTVNRNLQLDVFQPASKSSNRIAILIIHGGGWRSGDRSQHHALAQRLASKGYVCFTPEYRLSTEALYPAAMEDVADAVRWIRSKARQYAIDTSRIAVAGFSAGGQMAALLGTTAGKIFPASVAAQHTAAVQAVIDMDGTLSFIHHESGEGDDSKKTSAATFWFGYSKATNPSLWKQASPLTFAGRYTPPTLFLNSSVDRMHAGREDYRKTLDQYGIYHDVKTFSGAPHAFPLFLPWFDSTVQLIDGFLKKVFQKRKFNTSMIVARDGSGDFTSVQQALHSIPVHNKKPVTVFIKKGVYREKLFLDSTKGNLTIIGEDPYETVLTFDDHSGKPAPNGDTIHTFTSFSFIVEASQVKFSKLSFSNTAGNSAGQAVAMHIMGDKVQFKNCRFLGHQDVLYAGKPGTRQYYKHCYIEGTTDFIFGPSIAWFEQCHINSKRNSHITAASTPREQAYGYVFNNCVLTSDSVHVNKVSLGRPWRPYAHVVYINCYLASHIIPEGWNNWRNESNEKTVRYAEYGSYGPGGIKDKRVPWSKQLDLDALESYTRDKVLSGWKP